MAATGVKVADEVQGQFNEMKLGRIDTRFILYKIADGKIITDVVGGAKATTTFDDFTAALPPTEGRYGVFDCDYETNDGRPGNKLVFISWLVFLMI